jgi:hypothetical protein
MTTHDKAIRRFRLTLAALLVLKHALAFLTVWAFLWGTGVLALRAGLGVPRPPLLWGLAAAPLALVPALVLALRRLPSRSAVRAAVDHSSGCGGLLMAGEEQDLGPWQGGLPAPTRPRVSWRGGRSWGLLALAACYVLVGFLVPQRLADLGSGTPLEVGREVDKLAHQVEALKEEAVLDPARADALKQKLDQLRDQSSGKDPVKTLEALDHLEKVTNQAARDAADSAARQTEEMARAETLAEALRDAAPALSPKVLAEAMAALAGLTKQAAAENDLLAKHLDPETAKACHDGKLSPEQLRKLARALGGGKKDLARRLARLHKAGLLDREALEKCAKCGECNGEGLAEFLKENGCKMSLADMLSRCKKGGRGGITRGPGEADLTFGKETSEEGLKFKEETLPPAALQALKDNQLSGVSQGTPQVGGGQDPAQAGALVGARAGGGSANTQVVLPRHRGAVARYFERPARPAK